MAITKNHSIVTTLKKSIDYICDPSKTDEELLIYSYGCSPKTADIEFVWTQENAREKTPDSKLARHLIQSFEPGETNAAQAHEIGKRLAEEVLKGKYEFILATHVDKGHIHNHIIFNDVNFIDYHRSHINEKWYYNTRRISDNLCKEYGLSIIIPSKNKGRNYKEQAVINKGISWKKQLQITVDAAVAKAKNFNEFISIMESKGYKVKLQNKNISFCTDGRERYMRSKTLGIDYTLEALKERIAGTYIPKQVHKIKPKEKVSLLIDIQNCIKAQENRGYEHWAKINNLKQMSKTVNFITDNKIESYEQLAETEKKAISDFGKKASEIKTLESKIKETSLLIKQVELYIKLKPVYEEYRISKNKTEFYNNHTAEVTLFESALATLKEANYPQIKDLKEVHTELTDTKSKLYSEYKKLKAKVEEIGIIKSNVDTILGASHRKERENFTERQ